MNQDALIGAVRYEVDEDFAHLFIKDPAVCQGCPAKPCLDFCPAGVYCLDRKGHVMVGYQACLDAGAAGWAAPFSTSAGR